MSVLPIRTTRSVGLNSNGAATQIEKIDYSGKKIIDTGNQLPNTFNGFGPPFSPDGTLAFTAVSTSSGYDLQANKFNVSTSQVSTGAQLSVGSSGPYNIPNVYYTATRF